jgi:asparagine synthase (glutamine-hydrolysing)
MCGICGFFGAFDVPDEQARVLGVMTDALRHRGPDSAGAWTVKDVGLGVRRLALVDVEAGHQPMTNEDGSLVLVCNGEIYEYRELTERLRRQGHHLRTRCDVEVILHLYEEYGTDFLADLNGQFAFALYDVRRRRLLLARDHVGINPLYYTKTGDTWLFASEIKALLASGRVPRTVDLTGLDQVLSFPGLVSPTTMFAGVASVRPGHYVIVEASGATEHQFWDLDYPQADAPPSPRSPADYFAELDAALTAATQVRLLADVPVGLYLSGGLDSSLLAALARRARPAAPLHAFSLEFEDAEFSEGVYQRLMARHADLTHHVVPFRTRDIASRLQTVVASCECPIKETYNTASHALSQRARATGIHAVISGEGADELFAGYVGYKFDCFAGRGADEEDERDLRARLWGDRELFYETDFARHRRLRRTLYSDALAARLDDFDCTARAVVDTSRLAGRHRLHQRSYLDFKLRMADHLLAEHGDRMALANSVEARYPFLDLHVIRLVTEMPPDLKLHGFVEKYALRRIAEGLVPAAIHDREKHAFVAPGTPHLLHDRPEWIDSLLSPERIRRDGFFNPAAVERLRRTYADETCSLHPSFETDFLAIVLSFSLFLDAFQLTRLG